MRAAGIAGALILLILLPLFIFAGLLGSVGGVAAEVEETGPHVPAYLEAVYRQIAMEESVDWTFLAAWDGAENEFQLPIPTQAEIYRDMVREAERRRQEEADEYCATLPPGTPCPDLDPLTEAELLRLYQRATERWNELLRNYIRGHAVQIHPDDRDDPESFFARVISRAATAEHAVELQLAYAVLQELGDDDHLIDHPGYTGPPPDWTPIDGFAWPADGTITSRFGMRESPIDGQWRLHAGIDLAIVEGTPVRASRDGTVIRAEWDTVFGNVVVVDHANGYTSLYAHNSELLVSEGMSVVQGQQLSRSGSTGWSTGPHLHFEIHYQGTPVDPLLLLGR